MAEIRAFNRFYTGVIGVLHQNVLDAPYSLTEVRVLFELDRRDLMEAGELRRLSGSTPDTSAGCSAGSRRTGWSCASGPSPTRGAR